MEEKGEKWKRKGREMEECKIIHKLNSADAGH